MAVLAGAASLIAALAVVVALQGGGENREVAAGDAEGGGGAQSFPSPPPIDSGTQRLGDELAPGAPAAISPVPPDSGGGFAPGRSDRRIERSASLTLAAPEDRLERVANDIIATTDRYDGFVLRSSVSTGEEGASAGDFELRIPGPRLQPALRDLSRLADVRARTQAGQDITREFVSVGDRLRAARAERRGLLNRLETAETDTEAESIRRRLDLVAAELNGLRGRLRGLRLRSNYATVAVTLERAGESGSTGAGGSGDGLEGALDDAVGSLSDSAELLVRALGVVIAPALLAALGLLAARAVRRRRREAALSA
jgi:hypothetical protein